LGSISIGRGTFSRRKTKVKERRPLRVLKKTREAWARRTPLWVKGDAVRKAIVARLGARAARSKGERCVSYNELPINIKRTVDEIYWLQRSRLRRRLSITAGTTLLVFGGLARTPAVMEAGRDVAKERFLPPAKRGSLRDCYKRLQLDVAETNHGKIMGLRESTPNYRIKVDIFGNFFFKPEKKFAETRRRFSRVRRRKSAEPALGQSRVRV